MSKAEAIHAHTRVAAILDAQGKPEEAIAEFLEATTIADTDPPVQSAMRAWLWNQVGNRYEKLGRLDDALDAFKKAAAAAKTPPPGATGPTGPIGLTGATGGTAAGGT